MKGGRRLWLHVAPVLTDIRKLCRAAHAAELRGAARRAGPPPLALGEDPFGAHDASDAATAPMGRPLTPAASSTASTTSALPAPDDGNGLDVVAVRSELRSRLGWLKGRLSEALTEREVYYALFPIVVYADELLQAATSGRAGAWPPLQRELYEVDNGGELFFATIDLLLRREETSPLIFEIFYFCLNDGFAGQHAGQEEKLEEYRARLAARIPVERPAAAGAAQDAGEPTVELVEFPKWYYAGAAAALAVTFGLLHLLSHLYGLPAS